MKKWVQLVCVILCVLLVGGCAAPFPGVESSPESAPLTVDFDEFVSDNPIDKEYDTAMLEGNEAFETIAIAYCDAWKEEFRLTKEHIPEFFDEEQSLELMDDLTSWETIVMNNYRWIMVNIHHDSRFSSPFGSQGFLEEYVELTREYRYKTLWLKRIFFMVEMEKRYNQNEEQELPTRLVVWYSQT